MHYLIKIYRKYFFIRKNIHAVLINMLQLDCKTYLTDTVMKQELARRSFCDIFCKLGRKGVILHFLNKIFCWWNKGNIYNFNGACAKVHGCNEFNATYYIPLKLLFKSVHFKKMKVLAGIIISEKDVAFLPNFFAVLMIKLPEPRRIIWHKHV